MDEKKKALRDRMQNLMIVLLSVSAVLLFTQTQLSNLGVDAGMRYFSNFRTDPVQPVTLPTAALLSAPLHIAVNDGYVRTGKTYTTTADPSLASLTTLLGEALGSAGTLTACSDDAFRDALSKNSIYYDFTTDLPLPILSGFVGTAFSTAKLSARRLVLAEVGTALRLYLQDGTGACASCTTAISVSALSAVLESYGAEPVAFAFEQGEDYGTLSPYTLFAPVPVCNQLTAAPSLTDESTLLRQLAFNPHTKSRYTESGGTEVIFEGTRTLRIRPDGTAVYQGDTGDLSIALGDTTPTLTTAILGVESLAETMLSGALGDATLFLQSVHEEGGLLHLRFDCQIDGIEIRAT
ncbi:MAG: hypothetical protein RR426_07080, partial [Oscillospiraceae bacterium]